MVQTVNLITYAGDIDQGYVGQDDSAAVSIEFKNSASQTIGPVFNIDRAGITATIFRQKIDH
jgi:hypothetical protein